MLILAIISTLICQLYWLDAIIREARRAKSPHDKVLSIIAGMIVGGMFYGCVITTIWLLYGRMA